MRIVREQRLQAGAEAIYGLIAEPHRRSTWMGELKEVGARPGEVAEGDTFRGVARFLGHEVEGLAEVAAAVRPERVAEVVRLGVTLASDWRLREHEGRTTLTHVLELELPPSLLRPLESLVLRWWLSRMQRRSLRVLARLAEQ